MPFIAVNSGSPSQGHNLAVATSALELISQGICVKEREWDFEQMPWNSCGPLRGSWTWLESSWTAVCRPCTRLPLKAAALGLESFLHSAGMSTPSRGPAFAHGLLQERSPSSPAPHPCCPPPRPPYGREEGSPADVFLSSLHLRA